MKCPNCNKKKWIARSFNAGYRICLKCGIKFRMSPDSWVWKDKPFAELNGIEKNWIRRTI